MIGLVILPILLVQSQIYQSNLQESNQFLKGHVSTKNRYEQSKEIVENARESCLYQYRQEQTLSQRRQNLSPICKQYCSETDDCQQENEQSACTNPAYPIWSKRTMKFVQKYQRICYIRITEIVRYDRAEEICTQHGLQMAILDNIPLLEHLKQMHMFNSTCRGQCPQARGYYIGLKRQMTENNLPSNSSWIWSNNITWTQNETQCNDDDYADTSFANSTYLCYTNSDGEQKVTVWNEGEPNNRRYNQFLPGEQCVEVIGRPDHDGSTKQIGKLNDIPCNKPVLGVICQIDDLKPVNSTRFQYFATLIGFNETNIEENILLKNFLANFTGSIDVNLDAMSAVTTALEQLLALPSFTSEQATSILKIVDQLVNVSGQIEIINDDSSLKTITNKLLRFLDLFPAKIAIHNDTSLSFRYENLNTSIAEVHLSDENQADDWFTVTSGSEIIVDINFEILKDIFDLNKTYRIVETIFSNFNLFPQFNQSQHQLQGVPISYHIVNETSFETDQEFIRFRIHSSNFNQPTTHLSCAYWSFEDKNGSWKIDNSCRFAGYVNNYAECYCKHLTHFALLMVPESKRLIQVLTNVEEFIIHLVTYVGIILSIVGLVITIITYLLFRYSNKNHLHLSLFMLCLALLCVNCLYLPFSQTKPTRKLFGSINLCNIFGFLLHYFLLSSFFWMLIIATVQYMYFVRIFDTHISKYFLKTSLIGWILPLLFPILVILIGENGGYTGVQSCWINNDILLYTTFIAPICVILCYNLTVFLFTIRSICQTDSTLTINQTNKRSKLQLTAVICCFISIGCTWFFGIFVLIQPIFINQLIFCLSNAFQGFFIFLLHVYFSKPKRDFWRQFFIQRGFHQRRSQSQQPTSEQTDTNDSNPKRPVKLQTAAVNPAFEDIQVPQQRSSQGRPITLNPLPQPDYLYDRIQRAKLAQKSLHA